MRDSKIAIIGNGNVGSHLIAALSGKAETLSVSARTLEGLPPDADLYIIAVKDEALPDVAGKLRNARGIVAHTSGSLPMQILDTPHRGVFYPLQSFTKDIDVNMKEVPILIEGCSQEVTDILKGYAGLISDNVLVADSERRKMIHLAAVFANNFVNHLLLYSERILNGVSIDFSVLRPLVETTVSKAFTHGPAASQTGPAVRGDMNVIGRQCSMLGEDTLSRNIYDLMTRSIMEHVNNSKS